jgi:hypothetical protein
MKTGVEAMKDRALADAMRLGNGNAQVAAHYMLLAEVRVLRAGAIAALPDGEVQYWSLVVKELAQ